MKELIHQNRTGRAARLNCTRRVTGHRCSLPVLRNSDLRLRFYYIIYWRSHKHCNQNHKRAVNLISFGWCDCYNRFYSIILFVFDSVGISANKSSQLRNIGGKNRNSPLPYLATNSNGPWTVFGCPSACARANKWDSQKTFYQLISVWLFWSWWRSLLYCYCVSARSHA